MKTVGVVVALAALGLPPVAGAQYQGQHTGLPLIDHPWAHPGQYVENISEEGYGAILSAASLLSGSSAMRVSLTPQGGIVRSFGPSRCSQPTDHKEQARTCRQVIEAGNKEWMTFLRGHADRDGSGFVTTEEGVAIHEEVYMAFDVSRLGIGTTDDLRKLLDYRRLGKAPALARLAAYATLRAQAVKEGLQGMPALPAPLLQAARATAASTRLADTK
jgi:hypothetical protein